MQLVVDAEECRDLPTRSGYSPGVRDPPWIKATIFEPWRCARMATHLVCVRACHRCVCTCERLSLIGAIVADCATCEALKRACVEFGSVHGVGWVCGVGARVSMLAVIAGVTILTSKHTNTFVSQTTRSRCNSIFAVMH